MNVLKKHMDVHMIVSTNLGTTPAPVTWAIVWQMMDKPVMVSHILI